MTVSVEICAGTPVVLDDVLSEWRFDKRRPITLEYQPPLLKGDPARCALELDGTRHGHWVLSQQPQKRPKVHFLGLHGVACGQPRQSEDDQTVGSTYWGHVTCKSCQRTFAWQKAAKRRAAGTP